MKVFGILRFKFDGVEYPVKEGSGKLKLGGKKKTSQFASGKRTGASEETVACEIDVTIEMTSQTDLERVRKWDEGIAEVLTDVGTYYSSPNASIMEPPEVSDGGKGVQVKIEGDAAVKSK